MICCHDVLFILIVICIFATSNIIVTTPELLLEGSIYPFAQTVAVIKSVDLDASELCIVDILFPSNHNIHKSSCGLCFWASDPLSERF